MATANTMSYQYPYIEHYSPSPSTSTPQGFAQWENDQQVSPVQQLPPSISEESPTTSAYEPPPTIQLQERTARQAQQLRNANAAAGRDYKHYSPASSAAATAGVRFEGESRRETPGSASDSMPVRPQRGANRAQVRFAQHPYRRTSAGAPGEGKARRAEHEQIQSVSAYATMAFPSLHQDSGAAGASPTSPTTWSESPRRFMIRTDVHYSEQSNVLTAMLELPGVKKADLSLALRICPHSRVKQLSVSGKSGPVFADEGYTLRERKYGEFHRMLVVPPETTADSVSATMEDGILILRIPGGTPTDPEEPSAIHVS